MAARAAGAPEPSSPPSKPTARPDFAAALARHRLPIAVGLGLVLVGAFAVLLWPSPAPVVKSIEPTKLADGVRTGLIADRLARPVRLGGDGASVVEAGDEMTGSSSTC